MPPRAYAFDGRIFWFFATRVASRRHPLGRRLLGKMETRGGPLINLTIDEVVASGVRLAPRVTGVSDGRPVLADGQVMDPSTIIWCTGFGRDFSWIDPALLDTSAVHRLGMPFQNTLASGLIGGVGDDAARVARGIGARARAKKHAGRLQFSGGTIRV